MTLKELLNFEFTFDEEGEMIALVPLSRVNEIADILTNQKERIDKAIEYINELTELSDGIYTDYCDALSRKSLLEILGDKE